MIKKYEINGHLNISERIFSIVKAKKFMNGAFATINDGKELTIVIEHTKVIKRNSIKINTGWRLITFNFVLPFNAVGFISNISKSLADKEISIYVISSYSTDHILVKEKDLEKTIDTLTKLTI